MAVYKNGLGGSCLGAELILSPRLRLGRRCAKYLQRISFRRFPENPFTLRCTVSDTSCSVLGQVSSDGLAFLRHPFPDLHPRVIEAMQRWADPTLFGPLLSAQGCRKRPMAGLCTAIRTAITPRRMSLCTNLGHGRPRTRHSLSVEGTEIVSHRDASLLKWRDRNALGVKAWWS